MLVSSDSRHKFLVAYDLLKYNLVNRNGEKTSKKSIYAIDDNMFRFWYRFIPGNISLIVRGAQDIAYKRIEPFLSDYMGKVFEDICQQYLWQLLLKDKSPVSFVDIGRWWGNDKTLRHWLYQTRAGTNSGKN